MAGSTACDITAFTITVGSTTCTGTIGSTASSGKYPIAVEVPYGTDVSALKPTITVSAGATVSPTSGTAKNFASAVDYTVTAEDTTTTKVYTVTVTVDEESLMSVENINMAGWFKVKVVKLKDFDYSAGGFVPPYKAVAVLAVNGPGLTGYVYTDTSGTAPVQKIKLYSGANEASGELTADVYILIE